MNTMNAARMNLLCNDEITTKSKSLQLICRATQLTGVYMMAILTINELR